MTLGVCCIITDQSATPHSWAKCLSVHFNLASCLEYRTERALVALADYLHWELGRRSLSLLALLDLLATFDIIYGSLLGHLFGMKFGGSHSVSCFPGVLISKICVGELLFRTLACNFPRGIVYFLPLGGVWSLIVQGHKNADDNQFNFPSV